MKTKIFLLVALLTFAHGFIFSGLLKKELGDFDSEFLNFVALNQKNYLTVEELEFRKAIFVETMAEIDSLNSNPNDTATYGPNFLSDMTKAEKNGLLGLIPDENPSNAKVEVVSTSSAAPNNANWDWRS